MSTVDAILDLLRSYAGIDAVQTGEASLRRAIQRQIDACQTPERLLDTSSGEWRALLETSLVPETWFFRNMEAFEALAKWAVDTWVPAHPSARLRVLSLPCATGEEPFSIAMCLLEAGLPHEHFKIRAGDISQDSLAKAREATYVRNSFRSGFDERRFGKSFFEVRDGARRLRDEVRQLVEFEEMNLIDPTAELPASDVIFCRNALIYFGRDAQVQAVTRLRDVLSDDGILFLGSAETHIATQCGLALSGVPMSFSCVKRSPQCAAAALPSASPGHRPAVKVARPKNVARSRAAAQRPEPGPIRQALADSIERARALADAGDASEAESMLSRLAGATDPSSELFCLRGVVSEVLGRGDLAEAHYRKSLYLDPAHYESLTHLALLLELAGRHDDAQRLKRRATKVSAR